MINFNPPAMPYGPATSGIGSAVESSALGSTGNNRGAAALSWFQAIGGLGTDVLSVLTGNPAHQNTTINTPAPGAQAAPAKDYTLWIVGGFVLVVVVGIAYFILRKKS